MTIALPRSLTISPALRRDTEPLVIRSTYMGSSITPCDATPSRSASTRSVATTSASSALMPTAVRMPATAVTSRCASIATASVAALAALFELDQRDRRSTGIVAPQHLFRDARQGLRAPGQIVALQEDLVEARHAGGHRDLLVNHCGLRCFLVAHALSGT